MIINRRIYHNVPGKFRDMLALAKEIRALTKEHFDKDIRIVTPMFGPFATLALEFDYEDVADMEKFGEGWYPLLEERGLIVKWFELVQSGTNELWHIQE